MSPTITSRQSDLLQWMRERPAHNGLTATEIVKHIGWPYDQIGHYRSARCFEDLKDLAVQGLVVRLDGRPARWEVADGADDGGEECVFCGELRAPHEFEDGLRCVYCAREQDRD